MFLNTKSYLRKYFIDDTCMSIDIKRQSQMYFRKTAKYCKKYEIY